VSDVFAYLLGRGIAFLVFPHPAAVTVSDTVRAHGLDPDELVRTEVVTGTAGPALMVVPAARYLDLDLVRAALKDPDARQATHAEIRSLAPSCEIGAVPPLSLYLMAPMYVDPAVADREQLVFAAGRPTTVVVVQRADLLRDDPYVIAPLTRESAIPEPALSPSRRQILSDETLTPVHLSEDGEPPGGPPADVA
jgi:prolyl-tRNA editing enzyme YbaK/EbsC (Cys-tRNA(Pro) deacylase)